MRARDFERQLGELLKAPVEHLTSGGKVALVERHLAALLADETLEGLAVRFEPFVPGRRATDEGAYPGLGSSEQVGLYNRARSPGDRMTLLVRCYRDGCVVPELPAGAAAVVTIEQIDADGLPIGVVPGWDRRDVGDQLAPAGGPAVPVPTATPRALALVLDVNEVFGVEEPGDDHLGFGDLFHRRYRVGLDVVVGGARMAGDDIEVAVYNEERFGSLYQRLVDVLLPYDTARQAGRRGSGAELEVASHPWFPVLCIGMQKAHLYMEAIASDLLEVDEQRMLTDPGWLLRVGLYLELLTCLGIAEAVRDEIDILTPSERQCFDESAAYDDIRDRIDKEAWQQVWRHRDIALGRRGLPSAANLLRKKSATFAFLHAHHEDLKHSIDLAGPNLHNAQETWHRVFRDAERAVLQMNRDAFPELLELPGVAREFALWHESGSFGGLRFAPRQLTELFGDQDGVFPSACRQYRASMNEVAAWALDNGLMEYTGDECIPPSASLLEAHFSKQPSRLARLQWRDGYAGSLEVRPEEERGLAIDRQQILESLQHVELLSALTVDELQRLAEGVRPIVLGHLERIIIQGREGSSLFILQDGELEVLVRDGVADRQVAVLQPPAVVGELAFLLDEPRSATVRAIEQATVLELGAAALRPIVEARPAVLDALTGLLEERRRRTDETAGPGGLMERVRRAIFAS